ncbi:MAG: hypothetical protein UV96_C0041G0009 [Parcubacteria group bacterium GW2011_GWF2_43_38]|nr:MAG: hypothetical protein UV96_C0041G0009 [Parcubacteria group bacterium GW2011_GWF2_43_38]
MKKGDVITTKHGDFVLNIASLTNSIVSVTHTKLNRAKGTRGATKGTSGIVKFIHVPNSGIRLNNIFDIQFEGQPHTKDLKIEDLI